MAIKKPHYSREISQDKPWLAALMGYAYKVPLFSTVGLRTCMVITSTHAHRGAWSLSQATSLGNEAGQASKFETL